MKILRENHVKYETQYKNIKFSQWVYIIVKFKLLKHAIYGKMLIPPILSDCNINFKFWNF